VDLPSKHTKIIPVVSVIGLPPKGLHNKRYENIKFLDLVYTHASWQHCVQL